MISKNLSTLTNSQSMVIMIFFTAADKELMKGVPYIIYQDLVDQLIENEDSLLREIFTKTLYIMREPYLPFDKLQKFIKLYLSIQELYRTAIDVYDSVDSMTTELAEKLLRQLSLDKEKHFIIIDNINHGTVTRDEFVQAALHNIIVY
jgi:hypothetical protein